MTLTRQALVARSDARTLIRNEVNDPATTRAGTTIAAAQRRFSDTEVDTSFNFALAQVSKDTGGAHPGNDLVYVDGTYAADSVSAAFPSGVNGADLVYKIEDITNILQPRIIPYVSPLELERYATSALGLTSRTSLHYSLFANGTDMHIGIRPRPQASSLPYRVWYIAAPVVTAADADTQALTAHWLELLVLCAAIKLLRRDDEATEQQIAAYAELKEQFKKFHNRQAGSQRIRRKRRGWS